ncbi:unnamed protein product [Cuscuta campestris]|uniref:CCHC-type domain-containing protein n=1 Tax=Cuscuta campestris TaxID=132261 RepID=A0A484NJ02_9ASTE|nr:unnamed protein product [Cuscuta campestris]
MLNAGIGEGQSTVRLPFFDGTNYSYWKERMRIFVQSNDFKIWLAIKNGDSFPMKKVGDTLIPKDEDEYDEADFKKAQLNATAINFLYCAVNANDYQKISRCQTANQMWNKLMITYEGTPQVRESKIDLLTHEYELFAMKENELVEDMFGRFSNIVNDLDMLGKTLTDKELLRKILRSLTKEWESKVNSIYEGRDYNVITYDGLRGNLITYETNHLSHTLDVKKRTGIAFKASSSQKVEIDDSDSDSDSDNDSSTSCDILVECFNEFLKHELNKSKKKNTPRCHKCGKLGHRKFECPKLKKMSKQDEFAYFSWSYDQPSKDDSLIGVEEQDGWSGTKQKEFAHNTHEQKPVHTEPDQSVPATTKGKESRQDTWTVVTSKKVGPGTVWRKIIPSGPGESSNKDIPKQLQDKPSAADGPCSATVPYCNNPEEEEIKAAIWHLNPNSSAGPDGYNGEGGGGNVMVKLDMAKAFDKISWSYLKAVLKSFGFNDHCIALLLQNLEATHISVLINGSPNGFLKIKRAVKQGDPLSPLLFIIGSEGFSRSLNHAIASDFLDSYKAGRSQVVSHLAFADDLIVFLKGDLRNILRFKHILLNYLRASGQEINNKKSKVFCKKSCHWTYKNKLEKALGFMVGSPPFKYLGSTITSGKLKRIHCEHILNHFDAYLNSWYSKELNPMSRLIPIKHVLSVIPLHTLAVQDLPKSIINIIQGKLANFFWGTKLGKSKHHWPNGLLSASLAYREGGLGLRSLEDLQKACALKLWWKVINANSLWSNFVKDKYYRDGLFETKLYDSASWKRICRISTIGLQNTYMTSSTPKWINGKFTFKEAYWAAFADYVGEPNWSQGTDLSNYMLQWWENYNKYTIRGLLKLILPRCIIWNLWKAYNRSIYEERNITNMGIIIEIQKLVQHWYWSNKKVQKIATDEDIQALNLKPYLSR